MDRLEEIRQHCEGGGRGCDGKGGKRLKLGSLFDGSGGFPLSGVLNGIEPVWAAEVEPYPIAVTRSRFPHMKHYGDVSKMRGAELEPVDIITFGSPCQDMSIAGKREGLKHEAQGDEETTRSGLFYEAIRIVKEMREATNGEYPKYAVWENVPGAFSSNKGYDFHAVLEALCSVCDSTVSIPKPYDAKRTNLVWNKAGEIVGDNYSIAWRTLDAQYWGVPQRRKRIYLVADFTGGRAGEILFKQDGLRGDLPQGDETWQGSTADAVGGVDGSIRAEIAPTVKGAPSGTAQVPAAVFEPKSALEENWGEATAKNALRAGASKSSHAVVQETLVFDETQITSPTNGNNPQWNEPSHPLASTARPPTVICKKPPRRYIIRRLTPTECARLQGFPDKWGHLAPYNPADADFWENVRKTHAEINGKAYKPCKNLKKWYEGLHTDSAEYKMWGNGIALPCAEYVMRGIKKKEATDGPNR